jgi:hypothetical protein
MPFTAIIMAADRGPDDPVTRAAGVSCKALTPVDGIPMVLRVLNALEESVAVGPRLLSGPPRPLLEQAAALKSGVDAGDYGWTAPRDSPSVSAGAAMEQIPDSQPVLLTTADHDLLVGLAHHELVATTYPGVHRTRLRFSDRDYCTCNLFAFMTPRSRAITVFWRNVESQRKRPWRIFAKLGWWPVFKYLLGRLSLQEALDRISGILGMKIGVVILPFANAAVDVDTEKDWRLVQQILAEKE